MPRAGRLPCTRPPTGSTACRRCRRAASAASRGWPRPGSPSQRSCAHARPGAARQCRVVGAAASSRRRRPEPRGGPHKPCGRLPKVSSPFRAGVPLQHTAVAPPLDWTARTLATQTPAGPACRAPARSAGSGYATAPVPDPEPSPRSVPSTRRAVPDTLRSSTSRTCDNCAIVRVCAVIRCARCRSDSDAGGREIVHWVSGDDDMAGNETRDQVIETTNARCARRGAVRVARRSAGGRRGHPEACGPDNIADG